MSLSNSVEWVQVIVSTIFLVDEYTSSVKRKKEKESGGKRTSRRHVRLFSGRYVIYGDMTYLPVFKVQPLTASTNNRYKNACKAIMLPRPCPKRKISFSVILNGQCGPNRSEEEITFLRECMHEISYHLRRCHLSRENVTEIDLIVASNLKEMTVSLKHRNSLGRPPKYKGRFKKTWRRNCNQLQNFEGDLHFVWWNSTSGLP